MTSQLSAAAERTIADAQCYHCGEAVPPGTDFSVEIDGELRSMCCPGCEAVAGMIAGSGLESFYRQRTALSQRPEREPGDASHYAVYDDPQLAATFTQDDGDTRCATILVGGITCAACTWLIERALQALPGVVNAQVNLSLHKLDVRYRPDSVNLSTLFSRLDSLGYRPLPFTEDSARAQARGELSRDLRRLGVAGLGMMQVGMFAIALHAGDLQGMAPEFVALLRWVSLPVAAFVVFYSARPFFESAWRHLRVGALVMDLPVAIAIGLAFVASCWATFSGGGQVYFDSVVMFTFFLLLGRYIERRARASAAPEWSQLHSQLPDAVAVRRGANWCITPRIAVRTGDNILIKPGEMIALDAVVSNGASAIREDAFTGESRPRTVSIGDTIYAGTLNIDGSLEATVAGVSQDTRLATLQRLVASEQVTKPDLARLADRVASWFVAGVLGVTALTAWWWLQYAPDQALWIVLSVLVISCPCALALATPAALSSATAALRRRGVLVRTENALESSSLCTHLIFDKTGTLTMGRLELIKMVPRGDALAEHIQSLCAGLQQQSAHPIARAFVDVQSPAHFETVRHYTGAGMEGHESGTRYRMGSASFCREIAPDLGEPPPDTLIWVALCRDDEPIAWIGLRDQVRPEAATVVELALQRGLSVELLTGDSSPAGPELADSLGMSNCRSGQSPEDKLAYIAELQQRGAKVCMVGDGINDGPVLARADASFAVPGATDLARTKADFVLVSGNLHSVLRTLDVAQHCRRVVKQNVCWALGYNTVAIPLAAAGLVQPWIAAIGMSASSLLVVANSLRLGRRT